MYRIRRIRRLAGILASFAAALLAVSATSPAAFASLPGPGGAAGSVQAPQAHAIVAGGMPGWQITVIAVGAALLAAVLAVFLDRAWAARRRATATAA
jgi:hypothetical protein